MSLRTRPTDISLVFPRSLPTAAQPGPGMGKGVWGEELMESRATHFLFKT